MGKRTKEEWVALFGEAPGHMQHPPELYYQSAVDFIARLMKSGYLSDGERLLDIGCGWGRMAAGMLAASEGLPVGMTYSGVDCRREAVTFCRRVFKPYEPGIEFHVHDARNSCFNPDGKVDPLGARLPAKDAEFDIALALSFFTHLGTTAATNRYFEEVARALKPGGRLVASWFRCPPNREYHGDERTALPELYILNRYRGWTILETWGGLTAEHHDQWYVVARKDP